MATAIALLFLYVSALSVVVQAAKLRAKPPAPKAWWDGYKGHFTLEADKAKTSLGAGSHGQVAQATMIGTRPVAVKVITDEEKEFVENESRLHSKCSKSPFVVKLFGTLVSDFGKGDVRFAMEMWRWAEYLWIPCTTRTKMTRFCGAPKIIPNKD